MATPTPISQEQQNILDAFQAVKDDMYKIPRISPALTVAALSALLPNGVNSAVLEDLQRGGNFIYQPQSTNLTIDNGIVFPAASGGFWVRQLVDQVITPQMFGAKSGVADDKATQAAIDYLARKGGGILSFPQDTYEWTSSVPKLPPGMVKVLEIRGNGSLINLSLESPRFFDLNITVQGQSFNNFYIHDFVVNANNNGTINQSHVILGSKINGVFQGNYNANNITLRNIKVINVPDKNNSNNYQAAPVLLDVLHYTAGEAQSRITNITLDNVVCYGGTQGFSLTGNCAATPGTANVYFDNILIKGCRDYKPNVTGEYPCSNIHIAGSGYGGAVVIDDFIGYNSGDNTIEVNAMMKTTIRNVQSHGANNYHIFFCNYREPESIKNQTFTVENWNATIPGPNGRVFSFGLEGSGSIRLGHIIINNLTIDDKKGFTKGGNGIGILLHPNGDGSKECESFQLNKFVYNSSVDVTSLDNTYSSIIALNLTNSSTISLNDLTINISGTQTLTGSQVYPRIFEINSSNSLVSISKLIINSSANFRELWAFYLYGTGGNGNITITDYYNKISNTTFNAFRIVDDVLSNSKRLTINSSNLTGYSSGTDFVAYNGNQLKFFNFSSTKLSNGYQNTLEGNTKTDALETNTLTQDGKPVVGFSSSSILFDPGTIATDAQQSTTIAVGGATMGQFVRVSFSNALQGVRVWGEVSAAGTVTAYFRNDTGSSVTLALGTLTVRVD